MRIVDDPAERFVVMRIDGEPVIGKYVFDFLSFVEGNATIDPIGEPFPVKSLLKWAGLCVGSV